MPHPPEYYRCGPPHLTVRPSPGLILHIIPATHYYSHTLHFVITNNCTSFIVSISDTTCSYHFPSYPLWSFYIPWRNTSAFIPSLCRSWFTSFLFKELTVQLGNHCLAHIPASLSSFTIKQTYLFLVISKFSSILPVPELVKVIERKHTFAGRSDCDSWLLTSNGSLLWTGNFTTFD